MTKKTALECLLEIENHIYKYDKFGDGNFVSIFADEIEIIRSELKTQEIKTIYGYDVKSLIKVIQILQTQGIDQKMFIQGLKNYETAVALVQKENETHLKQLLQRSK